MSLPKRIYAGVGEVDRSRAECPFFCLEGFITPYVAFRDTGGAGEHGHGSRG